MASSGNVFLEKILRYLNMNASTITRLPICIDGTASWASRPSSSARSISTYTSSAPWSFMQSHARGRRTLSKSTSHWFDMWSCTGYHMKVTWLDESKDVSHLVNSPTLRLTSLARAALLCSYDRVLHGESTHHPPPSLLLAPS